MKNFPAIFIAFLLLFVMTESIAHDGEIDACGGHTNDDTGEYHLHNYKNYRACLSRGDATKQAEKKMIFKCGSKSSCEEMANCKEAIFYLEKCGLTTLDENNNGVPCEKLCK